MTGSDIIKYVVSGCIGKRQINFENNVSDIKTQISEDSDKRRLLGREKYDYIQ